MSAVDLARLAFGAALLTHPPSQAAGWARVLGLRYVVHGVAVMVGGGSQARGVGAAIEAAHALSMVPAAAMSGRYRRPALASAAVATAFAAADVREVLTR